MTLSKAVITAVLCLPAIYAQQAAEPAERIRAAMAESLAKQQASVQRQVESVRTASPVRDAVSWPEAPALVEVNESASAPDCDPLPATVLDSLVHSTAKKQDLKPELLRAVIQKESAGRPCAVSPKGAQGLMQLMPSTASMFNLLDPFDPAQNIEAGSRFLKQLLTKYGGDVALALGAYNAGPGRVDRAGRVPAIPETQNYVLDILNQIQ